MALAPELSHLLLSYLDPPLLGQLRLSNPVWRRWVEQEVRKRLPHCSLSQMIQLGQYFTSLLTHEHLYHALLGQICDREENMTQQEVKERSLSYARRLRVTAGTPDSMESSLSKVHLYLLARQEFDREVKSAQRKIDGAGIHATVAMFTKFLRLRDIVDHRLQDLLGGFPAPILDMINI